jgi:hypothetical protein
LAGPKLKEFRIRSLFGKRGQVFHKKALQRIGKNLNSRPIELFEQLIMYSARKSSGKASGQSRSASLPGEDRITMHRVRTGFLASQKRRADLHTLGSKHKSSDYSARISDASGGNYGD